MILPPSYQAPWDPQRVLRASPFLVDMGVTILSLGTDGAVFELPLTDRLGNAQGDMHGGVLATLIDVACGFPARVVGDDQDLVRAVTLTLAIEYLAPPRGAHVRALGRLTGGGRSIVFSRAEVLDADGRTVALGSGSYKRLGASRTPQKQEK